MHLQRNIHPVANGSSDLPEWLQTLIYLLQRDVLAVGLANELVEGPDLHRRNALAEKVLAAAAAAGADSVEAALAADASGQTVDQLISDEAAIIGEKVELRRVRTLTGDAFEVYLHKTSKDLPPQVGVVLAYTGDDAETARSLAQHISFANPSYLSRDEVPEADVEKEREIVTEISRNEGKPEAALPKIVEGRVNAFFKQVALLDQDYAKDNKQSVAKVAADAGLTLTGFARFKVGA